MTGTCPHCHKDIEPQIYDAWTGDYWTELDDFSCPICGKDMKIEVELEPVFVTKKNKMSTESIN